MDMMPATAGPARPASAETKHQTYTATELGANAIPRYAVAAAVNPMNAVRGAPQRGITSRISPPCTAAIRRPTSPMDRPTSNGVQLNFSMV